MGNILKNIFFNILFDVELIHVFEPFQSEVLAAYNLLRLDHKEKDEIGADDGCSLRVIL